MASNNKAYDLEDRLVDFATLAIDIVEALPSTRAGNHIAGQLIRCCTSPAANYGEAESAESRKDFIHKMRISLKELRETRVWLRVIIKKSFAGTRGNAEAVLDGRLDDFIEAYLRHTIGE